MELLSIVAFEQRRELLLPQYGTSIISKKVSFLLMEQSLIIVRLIQCKCVLLNFLEKMRRHYMWSEKVLSLKTSHILQCQTSLICDHLR